jgi:uncharacterized membrane protein YbhN (UPF0104 family)
MLGSSVGLQQPLGAYVRFYFIGMFFNLFGPSTLGGDVVRALYLGGGRRPGLALNSVLFDRVSGFAVLMAVGSAGLALSPQFHFPPLLTAAVVAGGLGILLGWWTLPVLVCLLPGHNRLRRQVEDELAPFWRDPSLLSRVALTSAAFHLSQVLLQYLLVRAAGAEVPLSYCLIFHPLLSVMTALPISVSGFGVREGSYLFFLGRVGVSEPVAVAVGLLWWALTAVGGLVGGAGFLPRGRAPLARAVRRAVDPACSTPTRHDRCGEREGEA